MGFLRKLFSKKERVQPYFYEEIQSILRTTLIPLGFEEKEESGRSKYTSYSKGDLSVWVTWDILDSVIYVGASSRNESVPDFKTECWDMKDADEFKTESSAKLNQWLAQQKVE